MKIKDKEEKIHTFLLRPDKDIFEEVREIKKETGISMNKIYNLKFKGFEIKKKK